MSDNNRYQNPLWDSDFIACIFHPNLGRHSSFLSKNMTKPMEIHNQVCSKLIQKFSYIVKDCYFCYKISEL
jgi:hypothetical protein